VIAPAASSRSSSGLIGVARTLCRTRATSGSSAKIVSALQRIMYEMSVFGTPAFTA
jgi:hypothetical protein